MLEHTVHCYRSQINLLTDQIAREGGRKKAKVKKNTRDKQTNKQTNEVILTNVENCHVTPILNFWW